MTPDKRVEEIVEHAKKCLKQAGFIASTLNKQETADTQLEFILSFVLTQYHQDMMSEVNYIHYNLRNAIRNERDGTNIKGYENDVDKWLFELKAFTEAQTIIKSK